VKLIKVLLDVNRDNNMACDDDVRRRIQTRFRTEVG